MSIREAQQGLNMLAGLASFATRGLARAVNEAAESRKRQETLETLKKHVRGAYPLELANYLLERYEASGFDPAFNFETLAQRWSDAQLYRFLFYKTSEEFADLVMARKAKLAAYGIALEPADLFQRTLREYPVDGVDGARLAAMFKEFEAGAGAPFASARILTPEDKARREKYLADKMAELMRQNLFVTDTGHAVILGDYRTIHVVNGSATVFEDINKFNRAINPKKWDYVSKDDAKKKIFEQIGGTVIAAAYPS